MNVFGFPCKTPGCQAWLKAGDLPEDSPRAMHFPINLGDDPRRFQCPDCGQAHDYYFSEIETRKLVQEPSPMQPQVKSPIACPKCSEPNVLSHTDLDRLLEND